MSSVVIHDEVSEAVAAGRPVVALESTIFSHLGLPSPANEEALRRCIEAIRAYGAIPALTAVIDGRARIGLEPALHDRILGPARKVASRDLAVAMAQGWEVGATTVSASLVLAAHAGIDVFATGGIGGVHRDAASTGDISADLDALRTHSLVTTCAGAKAFLDLQRTLEHLETTGVPVIGWRSDEFPAFTALTSGLAVPHRAESPSEVADVLFAARALGQRQAVLVTIPVPTEHAVAPELLDLATAEALADAAAQGITGHAVTPFVLDHVARATDGRSIPANLALAEQNAAVGAQIAVAITTHRLRSSPG